MNPARMMRDTITLIAPAALDRHGDPLPGAPGETTVAAMVQPRITGRDAENTDLRDTVISGLIAHLPAGTTVTAAHRARYQGRLYDVDGEPGRWVHPRSTVETYVQVALKRVTG